MTRPSFDRLTSSRDVRRTLRQGQRRSGRLMGVHGLQRTPSDTATARLTVVASRRVGNAVERNRAKRLLREAARGQAWRAGLDVVLVARSACAASGLGAVSDEMHTLGDRLGLLVGGASEGGA
jgi:ribonuclease P protein component